MQKLTHDGRTPNPSSPAPSQSINIVRKERRGYARQFSFEIPDDETLPNLMEGLKTGLGASRLEALIKRIVMFQEEAIFEATVNSTIVRAHPDPEGGSAFVDLGPLTYSALLTEAYHNPEGLGDLVNVTSTFKRYTQQAASSSETAMVLGWKTCKTYMFINLSILCAISLLVGVVVGAVCRDANLGVAIGGGLFALLGVIVGLLMVLA